MAADDAAYKKAMRDLEAYIQEGVQLAQVRFDRLKAVLDEFWNYKLNYQLCAVEALFASTPQAQHSMSEAALDQLYANGLRVFDSMVPAVGGIYDDCAKLILALEPKAPARVTFTAVFRVMSLMLEHGSTRELQDMIWCSVVFCQEMRAFTRGIGSSQVRVMAALGAVGVAAGNIMKSVFDAVDQGRLLFKDGKFIKPDADKGS